MKTKEIETKKEIREDLHLYVDSEKLLNGSLEQVATNILDLKQRLLTEHNNCIQDPGKYVRFEILIDSEYDSSYPDIHLYGIRLETDKEFSDRLERSRKAAAAAIAANKTKKF